MEIERKMYSGFNKIWEKYIRNNEKYFLKILGYLGGRQGDFENLWRKIYKHFWQLHVKWLWEYAKLNGSETLT